MADRDIGTLRGRVILETGEFTKANTQTIQAVGKSEQSFKQFFQQQRTGDRIQRETAQSAIMVTNALSGLMGTGVEPLTRAITSGAVGMQQMEFMMFGLTRGGGALATSLAGVAGPISLIAALGFGLITFFRESGKEADTAAKEGLEKYKESLKKIYEYRVKLGMVSPGQQLEDLERDRTYWYAEWSRLKGIAPVKVIDRPATPGMRGEPGEPEIWHMEDRQVGTSEQIADAQLRILEIESKRADINKSLSEKGTKGAEAAADLARQMQKATEADARHQTEQVEAQKRGVDELTAYDEEQSKVRIEKLNELRLRGMDDEMQRIDEKYRQEEENLRKLFIQGAQLDEALANLKKAKNREIAGAEKNQQQGINRNLRSSLVETRNLANDLQTIFGATGEQWVQDLNEALSIITAIIDVVRIIGTVGGSGFNPLSFLGLSEQPMPRPPDPISYRLTIDEQAYSRGIRLEQYRDTKRRLD